MGTICGGVCGCRQNWEVPGPATRVLLATSSGHVLPAIARTARRTGEPSPTSEEPTIADVADVLVEVVPALDRSLAIMTDVRGGRRQQWPIEPLKA